MPSPPVRPRLGTSRGSRRPAVLATLGVLLAIVATAGAAGAETPIEAAQRNAAALQRAVSASETQADAASAEYDRASSELAQSVSDEMNAQQAVADAAVTAAGSADDYERRIRAVYMSGGRLALMSSVLQARTLASALDRYASVGSIVQGDLASANHSDAAVAKSAAAAARLTKITQQKLALQGRVDAAQLRIEAALAGQRELLANADEQVRVIAERNAEAERVAQEIAFAQALKKAQDEAAARARLAGPVYTDPNVPAPDQRAGVALAAARTQLGKPYVWGAAGPEAFDCSGLTGWAYEQAGVSLPRVSMDQWNAGPHPDLANLQPGDLVFWASDLTNSRTIHHVALYIGAGMMIAAPHAGTLVRIQPMYLNGYIGATRPT